MSINPISAQHNQPAQPKTGPIASCLRETGEKIRKWFSLKSIVLIGAAFAASIAFSPSLVVLGFLLLRLSGWSWERGFRRRVTPEENIQIFLETRKAIEEGKRIDPGLHKKMVEESRIVKPFASSSSKPVHSTEFMVTSQSTYEAARSLVQKNLKPLVLDMANRYRPGGGVLRGATAQEEDLCRQTNLYSALEKLSYPLPELGGAFVPSVQFFRDNDYQFSSPFCADVFVSAAYDCNLYHDQANRDRPQNEEEYRNNTKEKIRTMLRTAIENKNDSLVLSAYGCGAFKNDPRFMSELYQQVFKEEEFAHAFRTVIFGIYDPWEGEKSRNYIEFSKIFKKSLL